MAANTISLVAIQTFENNVRHIAQQGESLLLNWCQVVDKESASHNFERLGTLNMGAKTRAMATPTGYDAAGAATSIDWSRRQSVVSTFHAGEVVDQEDPVQMLVDPNSNIAQAIAKAARRKIDDLIIAAATGSSRNGAGSAVVWNAAQTVGDYSQEISFDFVSQVYEVFLNNNISADEEKVFVIAPKQLRKLQQLVEYTSSDYVNVKALAEKGYCPNWMGFTWIVSTRLGLSSTNRDCFAMTRRALGFHFAKNIWTRVAEDPSISFSWRVYTAMTAGAVRVEDEQIVWAKLKETVT